jgi:hypothetical protein
MMMGQIQLRNRLYGITSCLVAIGLEVTWEKLEK